MPVKPLTVGMVGENIAVLHRALTTLGFNIPEAETRRQFFGPGTREAIKQCQARGGLTPSGICDEATGALLNLSGVGGAPPARLRFDAPAIPSMPGASSGNGRVEAGADRKSTRLNS